MQTMTQPNPFEERKALSRSHFGEEFVSDVEKRVAEEMELLSRVPRKKGEAASVLDTGVQPVLGGVGGEHLVFDLAKKNAPEKIRDVVVKVNVNRSLGLFRFGILHDAAAIGHGEETMDEEMEARKKKLTELRSYFGKDSVPVQRFLICDMPVSKQIIDGWDRLHRRPSHRHWVPEGAALNVKTIPAWVEVQRRIDLDPKKTVSLNGTYFEHASSPLGKLPPKESERIYAQAHDLLVGHTDLDPEEQRHIVLSVYPSLEGVAKRLDDPVFVKGLRDMVRTLIRYSKETDTPLDLMGKNNIVLTETAQGWKPKLLDPLLPDDRVFGDFGTAVARAKKGWILDGGLRNGVFNAMNTVRVINALAILSGIPDRLQIKDLEEIPAAGWRRIMAEGHLRIAA